MNIKAIFFDAFGTLFDVGTGVSAKKTVISNIRSCGKSVDGKKFAEEWKDFYIANTSESSIFRTEREIFALRIEMFYSRYGIDRNAAADSDLMIRGAYERKAFPEVGEVIDSLRKKYKVFIASNTDNDVLVEVMKRNNINADKIYTSEDLKCYKPNPDFFRKILDDSGFAPQEVLFVGDSARDDIIGSRSAGIRSVLVCRSEVPENAGQDHTVRDLNELLEAIKMLDMRYTCPICGYDCLEEPPYIDGYIPSHNICDCCGSEFGLDDCTQEQIKKNRKKWADMGYPWFSPEIKPINWDPNEQLKNIQ